jgi:hypothetical protein
MATLDFTSFNSNTLNLTATFADSSTQVANYVGFSGTENYSNVTNTWNNASGPTSDWSSKLNPTFTFSVNITSPSQILRRVTILDSADNEFSITYDTGTSSWGSSIQVTPTGPFYVLFDNDASTPNIAIQYFSGTPLCLVGKTLIPKMVPIKRLKVGDVVRTSVGDLPISKILKSQLPEGGDGKEFVKISRGCLGNNYPLNDVFISKPHPISLGYVPNKDLNDGVHDKDCDDKVFIHIAANELVGKINGIVLEKNHTKKEFNLVFDKHASFNVEGIDVISHNAAGYDGQPKLSPEEFQDKNTKQKLFKPYYLDWNTLIQFKPNKMALKVFLRKCIKYKVDKEFQFGKLKKNMNILNDLNDKLFKKD